MAAVESREFSEYYGFRVSLEPRWKDAMVQDATGDTLDALLCSVQAAWAYGRRDSGYGVAADCDPLEGCIADRACCGD